MAVVNVPSCTECGKPVPPPGRKGYAAQCSSLCRTRKSRKERSALQFDARPNDRKVIEAAHAVAIAKYEQRAEIRSAHAVAGYEYGVQLHERIQGALGKLEEIYGLMEQQGDARGMVQVINSVLRSVETEIRSIATISQAANSQPVDLASAPEFIQAVELIQRALVPFPEAGAAVTRALGEVLQ